MVATPGLPAVLFAQVPVSQPAHLEGDGSLATEILPGPPSVQSARLAALKRDPHSKKAQYLYLPAADPGTSYAGIAGFGFTHDEERAEPANGKRSKSAAGSSTRAQRASARNITAIPRPVDENLPAEPAGQPIAPVEPETMTADASQASRSTSVDTSALPSDIQISTRPKRPTKGKGKEREIAGAVKEESKTVSPEPPAHAHRNEDYCSSCHSGQTSGGASFVYCDGCPRAFHLGCLDPPKSSIDDERWFCVSCTAKQNPPRKTPSTMLSSIIGLVDTNNATEFQLPEDIRTFFKDVTTGPKGMYTDTTSIKPQRYNRQGQLEERDPHPMRDRNGTPILCYRCKTSALPEGLTVRSQPQHTSPTDSTAKAGKHIISCDFCPLHWHLDCLDPPEAPPPLSRKWKCPVHADRDMPHKNRIPKEQPDIVIDKEGQYNNGNIEPIPAESPSKSHKSKRIEVDELLINGRRYRVPEKIIVLDFWRKVGQRISPPMSPLTEIDDDEFMNVDAPSPSRGPEVNQVAEKVSDEIREEVAEVLWGMQQLPTSSAVSSHSIVPASRPAPLLLQSDYRASPPAPIRLPSLNSIPPVVPAKGQVGIRRSAKSQGKQSHSKPRAEPNIFFQPQAGPAPNFPSASAPVASASNGTKSRVVGHNKAVPRPPPTTESASSGVRKRKKPTPVSVPPIEMKLRNKGPVVNEAPVVNEKPAVDEAPVMQETLAVKEAPAINEASVVNEAPVAQAQVDADTSMSSLSSLHSDGSTGSISAPVPAPVPRGKSASASADTAHAPGGFGHGQDNGQSASSKEQAPPSISVAGPSAPTGEVQDEKRTRGARKRKERMDDDGAANGRRSKASPGVQKAKESRPVREKRTPRPVSGADAGAPAPATAPATPSLKIRLPRLTSLTSSVSATTPAVPAIETPSR